MDNLFAVESMIGPDKHMELIGEGGMSLVFVAEHQHLLPLKC
jgi:hypothetical protein